MKNVKTNFLLLVLLSSSVSLFAQEKKAKDIEAIKKMCGCFEVTFNFAETFQYSSDSSYKPSKTKNDKALEWAQLVDDKKNKVSIQHILQVGSPNKTHIVKHWKQDWIYENTSFYMFNGDNKWLYTTKKANEVAGQWTQKVYQVDDSPRYEGSSSWVHVDGKSYWENTTDAPLPRREYTQRNDYNVTLRGNRQEITPTGWVHDQDNSKIIRKEGKPDVVLAQEKGYNTYVKVPNSKCQGAIDWWKNNQSKWSTVRTKWDRVFGKNNNLQLAYKVKNKPLYKHLFDEKVTKKAEINAIIDSFIVDIN